MFLDDMRVTVGPGWQEPKSPPSPTILAQEWATEKEARIALEDLLKPYGFILVPEVRVREPGKPFQRIDYVAICPPGWPIRLFGIEVKRGFPKLMHVLDVVEQAMRYRYAVIVDSRLAFATGDRLQYVFVWPRLNALDDCDHQSGSRAIRIMAGRANIGSIDAEYRRDYTADWRTPSEKLCLSLRLGQEYVWTERYGRTEAFGSAMKFAANPLRGLRAPK